MQDKLAAFDREQRVQAFSSALQQIDKDASSTCGTPLATKVDWSALDDDILKRLSVPSFCGEVVSQVATLCERDEAYKAQAKTLKGVECAFGSRIKLREKDATLSFTTQEDEPNQGDFINAFLRNR